MRQVVRPGLGIFVMSVPPARELPISPFFPETVIDMLFSNEPKKTQQLCFASLPYLLLCGQHWLKVNGSPSNDPSLETVTPLIYRLFKTRQTPHSMVLSSTIA